MNIYSKQIYKFDNSKFSKYSYELGPIRPPSEGQDRSLLIRATRNCPWNRCEFCTTYKGTRFEYRSVEEIKEDIDVVKSLSEALKSASWRLGYGNHINNEVINAIIRGNQEVYSRANNESGEMQARLHSLTNVANWLHSDGRTVFLQDANTPIMRTTELVEILRYLKESFPSIQRITSYGRSKTLAKKTVEEVEQLHQAGLSRLHIGLESGCDDVLVEMQKGVSAEEHIAAGKKIVSAGISLSEYYMPGLGGRHWSEKHAIESARVLNEINPEFIRLRSLIVRHASPLYKKMEEGVFQHLHEDEVISEIGLFLEHLNCNSYLASDQMSNLLGEIEGRLPEDKTRLLEVVNSYKTMDPGQRLKFRLQRRLNSYLSVYGSLGTHLENKVEAALKAIDKGSLEAEALTEQAISALKKDFV